MASACFLQGAIYRVSFTHQKRTEQLPMSDPVLIERRGATTWITINREERRNALNEQVVRTIDHGIAEAMKDGATRAIVLTGAGDKAFCAGADLAKNAQ